MKQTLLRLTPSTLQAGLSKARAYLERRGDAEVTLALSGGHYSLPEMVAWDAAQWEGRKSLRILGGGRIKTVLSSLQEIPAQRFTPVEGKPYYVCRLDKQEDGTYPNLRALYANGRIADISRTAEHRTAPSFEGYAPAQWNFDTEYRRRLYIPLAAVEEAGVPNCRGAEFHIRVEWEFKIFHIDHVDLEDRVEKNGQVYVAVQLRTDEINGGNGCLHLAPRAFFIANTTSVLTTPGQYAYERENGLLYYYPKGDISTYTFGMGMETGLFSLRNFHSVTLRGLTFTGTEDDVLTKTGHYAPDQAGWWRDGQKFFPELFPHSGALRVQNCGSFEIDDCIFTDLPCDAISMVGRLHNVTIRNSRFTHVGASAIRLGRPLGQYSDENTVRGLVIENNYLEDIGFTYENSCAILITKVQGARIQHNTLLRTSYTAISIGWKWDVGNWNYGEQVNLENVDISYNYIRSFMTNMRDGGAIYTLGGNVDVSFASYMNTLHDNVVIEDELTCPENGFFGSLYHDGASSNWYTHDNVVVHNPGRTCSARIYIQNGPFPGSTLDQAAWHILCENNYIVGCQHLGEVYAAGDWENALDRLDALRDLHQKDTHLLRSVKELKKIPAAARILDNAGCR
jgi:hypothetical protein